jgi:hypothetical protein
MEVRVVADEQGAHCNGDSVACSILENGAWTHKREALLGAIENLGRAAVEATNAEERHCFTIATILCSYAASEAFLCDWAALHAPDAYEEISARQAGLLRTAEEVLPKIGADLTTDLIELANVKNALCTSRSSTTRSPSGAAWHPSAQRAAAVAKTLYRHCFVN